MSLLGASKSLSGTNKAPFPFCLEPQIPPAHSCSHEAGSVPLGGPVVVIHIVGPAQVVHLLFPARRQRGRWQLLLTLRCSIAGIHHIPAVLRNKGKRPLWLQCAPHFNEKRPKSPSAYERDCQRWLGVLLVAWCQREPTANSVSRALSSNAADSTIFLESFHEDSALPQSHPSDHCFLPLGHHFWAYMPSSVSRNPLHEICGYKTRRYIAFNNS